MTQHRLRLAIQHAICQIRGLRLRIGVRFHGGKVGIGTRLEKGVMIRHLHAGWTIGDNVYIGRGSVLDVASGARLAIGNNVKIMHYVVVAAVESVELLDDVQVAEFTSIRDHNHNTRRLDMLRTPVLATPVWIGKGAWIGRGAAVLAGSIIGTGAVIAANAVVAGSRIPDYAVAAGVPARVLRIRTFD